MSSNESTRALFVQLYGELRHLALVYMCRERSSHTLSATALVHEAYLRLSSQQKRRWEDRRQFYGVAATMMRRVLVNHAQGIRAAKRGGTWQRVHLSHAEAGEISDDSSMSLLALEEALEELHRLDPRQSEVVCLKFYLGLTSEQVAPLLGISPRTVAAEWAMARAWLHGRLSESA